jgi:hypothetical protein
LEAAVRRLKLVGERRADPLHIGRRLLQRHARCEPPSELENAPIALLERARLIAAHECRPHRERHVEIGPQEQIETREALRCDADDGQVRAVHLQPTAEHGRVRAKRTLPEAVAHYRDGVPAWNRVLSGDECTPERGLHAHRSEIVARYELRRTNFRRSAGARGNLRENRPERDETAGKAGGCLAQIRVVGVRHAQRVRAACRYVERADAYDLTLIGDGQRPQQQPVREAECRGVGADPHAQGQDGDQGKTRAARQLTSADANVLEETRKHYGGLSNRHAKRKLNVYVGRQRRR